MARVLKDHQKYLVLLVHWTRFMSYRGMYEASLSLSLSALAVAAAAATEGVDACGLFCVGPLVFCCCW